MYAPLCQYITLLLSPTPPPPATTPFPKVRVDSPVVDVEYTTTCSTEVPDYFQAMLIMTKLPSSFDGLAQLFCQRDGVKSLDVADMRKTIGLTWEQ